MAKITWNQATKKILDAGWKPWYPVENVPMSSQMFWDGLNHTVGYAWGAAIKEIERRGKPIQLTLFDEKATNSAK